MSKDLGGNIGCRDKKLFIVLNGFPNVRRIGRKSSLYCTLKLTTKQGHQNINNKKRQSQDYYSSSNMVIKKNKVKERSS